MAIARLMLVLLALPLFAHALPTGEKLSPKTFREAVYKAIGALPPQKGFLSITSGGSSTDSMAMQYFVIDLTEKSAVDVVREYVASVSEELKSAGILHPFGLQTIEVVSTLPII